MINIILFQPEIPGNTGNIIRTCLATNSKLHIIKPIAFSLTPKWMKRTAAGNLLSDIQHEIHENYKSFSKKYASKKIFYITRYGLKNYANTNFKNNRKKDIFVMFGRESTGIPKTILQNSLDTCLRIPMAPNVRSLNLATTVMLIAYEIHRQNNFQGLSLYEVQKGKNWILK